MDLDLNDLDRRIWEEELADFVPMELYDAHTHVYDWRSESAEVKSATGPNAGHAHCPKTEWKTLDAVDAALFPGRRVHRICFPCPLQDAPLHQMNAFAARQVANDPESCALMHVRPDMQPQAIEEQLQQFGFGGFKPYRTHAATGDAKECRITDYLPETQIRVADEHGLLVMLHLAKSRAIADEENLADLERLTARYPRVQWILAHCARSYYPDPLLAAADRLRRIPNLWYEVSSVCDSDAMDALLAVGGPDRVMYGSDDIPVGSTRGKYITFGTSWSELNARNSGGLNLSHCDGRFTFVRYESVRALRRACRRHGYGTEKIGNLFYGNARRLLGTR
jgi:predicted TIM-barrel fold metal-dependent hydrolase